MMAYVRGRPEVPSIREVKVRPGPGEQYDPELFRAPVGTTNLTVQDVQPDAQGKNFNGKVYQWLKLGFPNGQAGWVRDDLLEIQGDGTAFGYGVVNVQTFAFALTRVQASAAPAPTTPAPAQSVSSPAVAPTAPVTPTAATTPVAATPAASTAAVTPTATTPAAATPVAPTPAAAPAPAVAPTPATMPSGPAVAIPITQAGAPTRSGPSTTFNRTSVTLDRRGRYPLLAAQRENAGQNYRWFKVDAGGQQVWVREDLVSYDGDTSAFSLPADLYPAPMHEKYWWVRGFNLAPNKDVNLVDHDGWDLGAATGEPIYTGPNGGLVVKVNDCAKCTPDRPSTLMQGYSLGDPSIFSDPGWGNGYGTYVIVRYTNDQLPASTRDLLASKGFGGGAIFVMYAHLSARAVGDGQTLAPGQQLGACGNTGNSEATHLHLEIRASKSPQFIHWAQIRSGVMDPVALFKR
jgi:murein DD-endopeptidase MepM/ murein hydrolase activator NlpD